MAAATSIFVAGYKPCAAGREPPVPAVPAPPLRARRCSDGDGISSEPR